MTVPRKLLRVYGVLAVGRDAHLNYSSLRMILIFALRIRYTNYFGILRRRLSNRVLRVTLIIAQSCSPAIYSSSFERQALNNQIPMIAQDC